MVAFNSLLRDAKPEQFARAAKAFAQDIVNRPEKHDSQAVEAAQRIMAMTIEELIAKKPEFDAQWDASRSLAKLEDSARAAKVLAQDALDDPDETNERTIRRAGIIMEMTIEELVAKMQEAKARRDERHEKT